MNEVYEMSDEERKELCQKLVREYPYMILEILKLATKHPGGYHPDPGQASPDWCVCREMPTQIERQCCGKEKCVTSCRSISPYSRQRSVSVGEVVQTGYVSI